MMPKKPHADVKRWVWTAAVLAVALLGRVHAEPVVEHPAALAAQWESELDQRMIPRWTDPDLEDRDHGGFLFGQARQSTEDGPSKKFIEQLRALYNLAIAVNRAAPGDEKAILEARFERQFSFLETHFYDSESGGWHASSEDTPTNPRTKSTSDQAWAIYLLADIAQTLKHSRAAERARATFDSVERDAHDPEYGGYFQSLDRADTTPRLRQKSCPLHIHMLLGLARLQEVAPDERVVKRLNELYDLTPTFLDANSGQARVALTQDWRPIEMEGGLNNRTIYGMSAELVWYWLEAAQILGRDTHELTPVLEKIAEGILKFGVGADGAVFYVGPLNAESDDHRVLWWPQIEVQIMLVRLYVLTGNPEYLRTFQNVSQWAKTNFDSQEWPEILDARGNISDARHGSGVRTGFHAIRGAVEILKGLDPFRVTTTNPSPPAQ